MGDLLEWDKIRRQRAEELQDAMKSGADAIKIEKLKASLEEAENMVSKLVWEEYDDSGVLG